MSGCECKPDRAQQSIKGGPMPHIKNKLFQPLTILLEGDKTLYLQAREEAEVSNTQLNSPHLQSLIKSADIAVTEEAEPAARSRRQAKPE